MPVMRKKYFIWGISVTSVLLLLVIALGTIATFSQRNIVMTPSTLNHQFITSNNTESSTASHTTLDTTQQKTASSSQTNGQYLSKNLQVNMNVKDPRKAAADIQAWITNTDAHATSSGMDYEQTDGNQYSVSMSFSVDANLYPQIALYLRDYAQQNSGKLLNLQEGVQDVTSNYIDTKSRLENLQNEQQRLLTLYKNANDMNDILAIEQRLSDVEGQIESTEMQMNQLDNQVTYYTVILNLQPLTGATPTPDSTWNPRQIFSEAWLTAIDFGEILATGFIWLGVFCIYLVPASLIGIFVWKFARVRNRRRQAMAV